MDLCDRNDIQALLARHGFRFAKSLGQNFLIRGDVAEDIAAAGCVSGCGVLEVGPGIGALTVQLARRAEKVGSVELDKRLPPGGGGCCAASWATRSRRGFCPPVCRGAALSS